MEVLTTDEALKTLKGSSARPFHSDVLDTEEAIKILRAHSQVEKREPKVYTVSKPQEPRTYHRNADGLMTQVVTQPTVKQQKQAENAARLDALAGRTGAQKDLPSSIGRPQMQSYTSQREGVTMQLPQIDQWNANAAMPAVKELAGKAVNMGTNILFPLKGMKQGVDLLTGKTQSTFDPEAERQALSQMGAVQRGVERVASGLNSIVETPAAALRYAGETAVQAGKNLAENFQKDGYGDRLSEAVYRKIKNQLTETAFDPVLLKYVSVPIGTPPDKVHEAYLKLQEEKGTEQAASAALKEITTDTPVDPNSAGTQMMRQTQERQAAAVEGLSPTGQFIGNTLASVGQNAMLMPLAAINPAVPLAGMAGMAGAGKAYEVQQAGGGAMEALARGTVAGLIEAATEKLPLDNLLKIASSPVGKEAIWNILEQMGIEATEEAVSYVANYIADAAAKDPNAEFSLKDMALSALGGGLSGGIMVAGGTVVGYARNGNVNAQAAQPTQKSAFTQQAGTDANAVQNAQGIDFSEGTASSVSKGEAKATSAELIGKLRNSIPEISRMKPVAQITGNEFAKGQKSLVQQVGEFFRSFGNKVTRQGLGDVRLDEKGIKSSMAHGIGRRKAAAFAAVPHVIQFGQEIDAQTNWKNRGYDTRVFAAPITVGGTETNYIAAVVTQGDDNRYYLHEVLDQDGNIIYSIKKEAGDIKTSLRPSSGEASFQDWLTPQDGTTGSPTSLNPTLPQQADGVNTSIPGSGVENDMLAGIRDLREPDMLAEAGNPNGFTGLVSNQNASRVSRRVRRALNAAGKKLGVAVVFDSSLHGDNGSYDPKTKTLRIAMDASDPLRVIFTHEATHRLKETSPELYAQFEEMALDALRESGSYDRVQYAVEKAYGEQAFREEAAAHFTRLLTEDIGEFEKLVGVNRNLAQKLLDLLDEVLHSAGAGWDGLGAASGDQDLLFGNYTPEQLTELRDAWAEMLQKADAGARGQDSARRSIQIFPDGKRYVSVDTDQNLFEGASNNEALKIARRIILDKFQGKVLPVESNAAFVNRRSAEEYTHPAKRLKDEEIRNAKMRSAPELDHLLSVSEYLRHDMDDGRHPDAAGGWDVYRTTFEVGGQFFTGEVKIKITPRGRLFYDITQIEKAPRKSGSTSTTPASASGNLFDPTVPQTEPGVNPHSMQEGKKYSRPLARDAEYRGAVASGDAETARRLLEEKAAEKGYTSDTEWRMNHRAPGNDGFSQSIDDVREMFGGEQIYSRRAEQLYGEGRDYDWKAIRVIQQMRGKPDADVTVYRAVPKSVKDSRLRKGDWVTTVREYAQEHGGREFSENGGYRIIAETVKSRDLYTDGNSIFEWGYDPEGEFAYQNTRNNVKRLEPTYDDEGELIPLSQRFNSRKADERYSRPLDARRALDEDAEGTDMKRLIADNRRMQKNIEALREQFYRSKPGQTSESAVRAKAREWRSEWKTRMKAEEITERLREIYRLAGDRRSEYSFSQYESDLKALAGEMLEDVSAGVSPEAQEVLSSVKNLRMTLSEQDRADFQDYEAFRREHLGRIRLVNQGGIEVDSAYQELSERFPDLFPESVTHPADRLRQIGDIVERMAVEENPYEHDMEYYTGVLTQEMMDAFWEIPAKKPTFADVMEKKAADAYQRGREKGEQSAQRQAERMNAQLEAVKRDRDERIAREREKNRNRRTDEMIKRIRAQDRQKLLRIAQKAEKLKAAPDVKARIAELIGDLDTQSVGILKDGYLRKDGVLVRGEADLRELRDLYWEARKNNPDFLANAEVENSIARLDKKQIADMDIDDVRNLTRLVQAITHEAKTSNELIADQSRRDAYQVRKQVMEELRSAARKKPKNLLAGLGQTVYSVKSLRPKTFFADISGYAHGATEHLYQGLEDGQTKMLDFQRKATQPFDEYSKAHQKQMAEWTGPKAKLFDAGIVRDGKRLLITPMMKMSLALHAENDTNLAHIKDGGITVPDAELYRKGKISEAYDQGYTVKLTPSEVKRIAGSLTEDERAFVALAREFFNRQSKQALNETSLELIGYEIANVDHYFPIKTDRDFGMSNFENLVKDGTIEGMGILKKRIEARNPIVLEGLDNVLARQISDVSKYYGMAIPVRNFNKVWSGSTLGYEGSAKKSMREAIGTEGSRYIEKLMKDIQSPHQSADALEQVLDRLRGNFAAATLNFNPSVAMSQAASYPTAAQVLGWKALGKGLTMKPASLGLIDKYTPLLWYRSKGYASTDMADMKNAKSWVQKLPGSGWIQGADIATVRQLWNAAEAWTQMNTDLARGSEEYYRKTAEMFNRTVYDTQPNYTTLQRPDILRSDSGLLKSIMMFQTQRMQNYNMMYETWNEMRAAKRNGRDVGKARAAAGATAATLLIANGVYTAMKAAVAGLIDRDKDYSEKDGTVSPGSWAAGYFRNFVKNMAGSVLFASELAEIGETVLTGKSYDLIEVPQIAAINELVSGGEAFARSVTDWASKTARGEGTMLEYLDMNGAKVCGNARKLALGIARCYGLPAENVEKYTIGILGQVSPGLAAQYENLYRKKTLADIAEVSGTRKGQSVFDVVLENRAGEMNEAVSKELYRLYKAVGKDAMPAAIPEEASGEKLTPKQYSAAHKNYSDVMQDALETALESKAYQNASDKQKAGMVKYVSELQKYAALKKEGIGDTIKWKEAALKGDGDFAARFSMAQYMYGEIKGNDTNRDGKTDPGSKKAAFSKWLNNAGFSASEKRKIMEYFYKS